MVGARKHPRVSRRGQVYRPVCKPGLETCLLLDTLGCFCAPTISIVTLPSHKWNYHLDNVFICECIHVIDWYECKYLDICTILDQIHAWQRLVRVKMPHAIDVPCKILIKIHHIRYMVEISMGTEKRSGLKKSLFSSLSLTEMKLYGNISLMYGYKLRVVDQLSQKLNGADCAPETKWWQLIDLLCFLGGFLEKRTLLWDFSTFLFHQWT